MKTPEELYDDIEDRYPGRPVSRSKRLWELRLEQYIDPSNRSAETILEKSVAMLAQKKCMPGYFNQCPVASGIFRSHGMRRSAVDLVHWSQSKRHTRLIELKWESDGPSTALAQILEYGMYYLFCRVHRKELPLHDRPLMRARHVALEVVAPQTYYCISNERKFIKETNEHLDNLVRSKTDEPLSMSLQALAFPEKFDRIPFRDGRDACLKCLADKLTDEARMVRDAFGALTPPWPSS